jgi:trans-L-3-hydroxyproline dehydratase
VQPTAPASGPIIRTYKGGDRRAAELAYQADARQAATSGWVPVAHRWSSTWDGHELAVVFEQREPPDAEGSGGGETAEADERTAVDPGSGVAAAAVPGEPDDPDDDSSAAVIGASATAAVARSDALEEDVPASEVSSTPAVEPTAATSEPDAVSAARSHARAVLQTLDLHCAGEPLRLIRTGYPQVPFAPILERRRWVTDHADWARQALMFEPRGHRDMYGAVLLPPYSPDADIAVLFMHNEGYSTMCGHGIIALTTGLIEEGLYPATEPQTVIRYETPAGVVTAIGDVSAGSHGGPEVSQVRFLNVPAYRHAANLVVAPPGVARHGDAIFRQGVRVDLAFGGAYYGIVDAAELGLRVVPANVDALTRAGAAITEVLRRDHTPTHPTDADLGFVYGTIIVDGDPGSSPDGRARDATLRNVTIFADAEVDRSPCGSGTSALLAHLYAQGRLAIGQAIVNAGIIGESFEGRVESETALGEHPAVVTSVAGVGYVTGYQTFMVDSRDPLGDGFLLR